MSEQVSLRKFESQHRDWDMDENRWFWSSPSARAAYEWARENERTKEVLSESEACLFCGSPLREAEHGGGGQGGGPFDESTFLVMPRVCPECGRRREKETRTFVVRKYGFTFHFRETVVKLPATEARFTSLEGIEEEASGRW